MSWNKDVTTVAPPFAIDDIDLTMAWSPLLHNNPGHRWLRQCFREIADAAPA